MIGSIPWLNLTNIQLLSKLSTLFQVTYIYGNYFDGSTKLFSGLYLSKFLKTLAKSFFP